MTSASSPKVYTPEDNTKCLQPFFGFGAGAGDRSTCSPLPYATDCKHNFYLFCNLLFDTHLIINIPLIFPSI